MGIRLRRARVSARDGVPLRPEQREKVLYLQARGAISELKDYLEALSQTPDCPGEAHALLELARNFQLQEIAEHLGG